MIFALDRAEAADDVAELLVDALAASETAVAAKTARLFLVSDILHNCGAPVRNASAYRGAFQARLPRAFESLRLTLRGMTSRIAREAFKKRVGSVLAAWSDWYLFQSEFLVGLEASFLLETPEVTAEELDVVRREIDAMDAEARSAHVERKDWSPMEARRHARRDLSPSRCTCARVRRERGETVHMITRDF